MADFYVHRAGSFETPGGVQWPVRPRDGVGIPQNPRIQTALKKFSCTAKVVHNGYDILNQHGDGLVEPLPFGAPEEDWEQAAETVGTYRE